MISIWSAKNFTPLSWFSAGQQGAWYDPSDLTTLYQDSAGTTPVTAVEQPVGKMLDKSGRGNHAIQATAGNRPTLSAKVNLLQGTDNCDAVNGWSRNTTGGNTFTNFSSGSPTNSSYVQVSVGTGPFGPAPLSYTINVIAGVTYNVTLSTQRISGSVSSIAVVFNDGSTSVPVNSVWTTTTIQITPATTGAVQLRIDRSPAASVGCIYNIANVDVRPTNSGALLPVYQRVNAATDYNTVGFPLYLKCNGTSSSMATNSIDFTATNQMTVVSGVRKLSDAALGIVFENGDGSIAGTNFAAYLSPTASYALNVYTSTLTQTANVSGYAAPATSVVTGLIDTTASTPSAQQAVRVNGSLPTNTYSGSITRNATFLNAQLRLFARAGTSFFFNGQFYGAIIVGQTQTTQQIQQAEQYMATKTGISF